MSNYTAAAYTWITESPVSALTQIMISRAAGFFFGISVLSLYLNFFVPEYRRSPSTATIVVGWLTIIGLFFIIIPDCVITLKLRSYRVHPNANGIIQLL